MKKNTTIEGYNIGIEDMPELPEVETIKLGLKKYLIGHKVESVKVRVPKIFTGNPKDVIGAEVKDVRRFAKVLSIDLSNGNSLVIHIKLTGQLIYRGPNLKKAPDLSKKVVGGVPGKHTHAIFKLDKGGFLYYNDVRRFGWIKIVKSDKLKEISFLGKLGSEPFKDLTFEKFKEILSKSSRPIKILLMDQGKIGGIGNIYANDALWLAKINPKRSSQSLQPKEQTKLYNSILSVLKAGIKAGGASELSFVTAEGTEGGYQKQFLAYGQEGKICQSCHKTKIEKIRMGGRGTYCCPNCQK